MALLSDIFSDIFARQENCLSRIDARTNLLATLTLLLSVIFSNSMSYPLLVLVFCVSTAVFIKIPFRLLALRLTAPMGMALVLVVLKSVLTGTTPFWEVPCLGWRIVITQEGFHEGLLLATRMIGALSLVFLLSAVTPAHAIFRAMRALGVPQGWVEIAMLMYRYIFVLLDLTDEVTAAQRVRLGYAGLRQGMHSAGVVGGTVILRAMDQAVQTNQAMKVRCYRGEIPLSPLPPFPWKESLLPAAVVFGFICLFFVFQGGVL